MIDLWPLNADIEAFKKSCTRAELDRYRSIPSDIWEKNPDDDNWRVTRKDFYTFDIGDTIIDLSTFAAQPIQL